MSVNVASVYGGVNSTGLDSKSLLQGTDIEVSAIPWVRNPSWPACSAAAGDNKITGLFAVFPDAVSGTGSNFFAVSITGDYQINYGDGTSTAYTSGTAAYYNYDFNDVELSGTNAPIIFNASAGVVERTAHGYTNGMPVSFYTITSTSGVSEGFSYYVVSATTDTFKFATVVDGSAVAFTNDGTATLLPYKVAVFTITPQSGSNLVSVDLGKKHNQSSLQFYSTSYLELLIASSTITSLTLGGSTANVAQSRILERAKLLELGNITSFASLFESCSSLQSVEIANTITTVTNMTSMFSSCNNLQSVPLFDTSSVTDMNSMFATCRALVNLPLFNTASVTNMSSIFNGCVALKKIPLFNTASVTNMTSMFNGCTTLQTVPLFNTISVTNMQNMFNACTALKNVPLFNTSNVSNAAAMFQSCANLTTVPLFNTAAVTTMSSMFSGCSNLTTIPLFNTASVTSMSNMFGTCRKLKTVPQFNTASVTDMTSMFSNCLSLTEVPQFNTASVTNMQTMLASCTQLKTIPTLNTAAVTNFTSIVSGCTSLSIFPKLSAGGPTASSGYSNLFNNCPSLKRIEATGIRYTFSVASCMLSSAALNEIYTNLPTVTGQTITVSGNYGTTGDDPTIATAKGWTVTG